ncbi:MAG: transposase [Hyphomicrobium sp.]|nr:transposase [Hyphomicrobium sp.]
MPNYRRVFIPGGTWFFTLNLLERRTKLLTENVTALRHAIFWTKRRMPFRIDALVILPDHLHMVITLPPDDADYPTRIRLIKARFSKSLPKTERLNAVREKKGERGIWQRRYWEHYIRDERDYRNHVAYCYYNPVKHGHAARIKDWPQSTFHRDVSAGRFEPDIEFGDREFMKLETGEDA